MPPKKRDKEIDTTKNTRTDHIQADHELFLQAFESEYSVDIDQLGEAYSHTQGWARTSLVPYRYI